MNIGRSLKQGFSMVFRQASGTVQIHKDWGTKEQSTIEVPGLKNNEKGSPSKVMFQFPERIDISIGDVIQQKGGADLWRVIEKEDCLQGDIYVYFEAKVEKVNAAAPDRPSTAASVVIHGPNYGGIQVASSNSIQNVSVEIAAIHEDIAKLRGLAEKLELQELDKEDLHLAFDRVAQLSEKPRSKELLAKVKERLDCISSIFQTSSTISAAAAPYIAAIAHSLGIGVS
jgi:hypothetical protein